MAVHNGFLVLSRKLGEKIYIKTKSGDEIVVVLTDIDRGKVRIGFKADKSVEILREELMGAKSE